MAFGGFGAFMSAAADAVGDAVGAADGGPSVGGALSAISSFTDDELRNGIIEALSGALRRAVEQLAQVNGFLGDAAVKILLPPEMGRVRGVLEAAGQQQLLSEAEESMNRAAERAVGIAADVFLDALRGLTLPDIRDIVTGPSDSATRYLDRTSRETLEGRFHPVVAEATKAVGATDLIKKVDGFLDRGASGGGLFGTVAGFVADAVGLGDFDLDRHVTAKALDGLFRKAAAAEAGWRADPAAAPTALVQNIFRAVRDGA
eukprot:TRINITY_DN56845_c0_g1_i1.p1 TRINITY_DN56845_c0_g1~~TRINITY_DN56845_c0_g1_i1.p1  ORF type:complete len:260 (+),score=55.49 TRINITY_DN56845_c0_g1_i1:220-999(+)